MERISRFFKIGLCLLLSTVLFCAPFVREKSIVNDMQWNSKFSEGGKSNVVVKLDDRDGNKIPSYGDFIILYIDGNRNDQCDIEARFGIRDGDITGYDRFPIPLDVKIDIDHDYFYDFKLENFDNNGNPGKCIEIMEPVPIIDYKFFREKNKQKGFATYGLEKIVPFLIVIAGMIVIFETDKREAK